MATNFFSVTQQVFIDKTLSTKTKVRISLRRPPFHGQRRRHRARAQRARQAGRALARGGGGALRKCAEVGRGWAGGRGEEVLEGKRESGRHGALFFTRPRTCFGPRRTRRNRRTRGDEGGGGVAGCWANAASRCTAVEMGRCAYASFPPTSHFLPARPHTPDPCRPFFSFFSFFFYSLDPCMLRYPHRVYRLKHRLFLSRCLPAAIACKTPPRCLR